MKPKIALLVGVAAVAAAVLGIALGARLGAGPANAYGATASPSSAAKTQAHATVGVARSQLGRYLVDRRGHALYTFDGDKRNKSMCNGACATDWPPLIASKPHAGAGVRASLLGRTKRKDGRWQVTYNHRPLYTFIVDTKKGQTNGEGLNEFGAEWDLVSPNGAKLEKPSSSSSTGTAPGYSW